MEKDSQPEPDYEAMDIIYELRNPHEDEVSQMRKFAPPGTLAGYWVSSDSGLPDSDVDDDSDEDIESLEARVYKLIKNIEE
jgi:hypothetical protein